MTDEASWFEQPQLWEKLRPYVFAPARWDDASDEVAQLVDLLGLASGARVLDFPCGPGRHSLELARRGFDVTGVDITPAYVDEASESAQDEGLEAEFIATDMREFRRDSYYDAVLNLFTSFGYFDEPADDMAVLEIMRTSLKPGGVVVLEMVAKEYLIRNFTPRSWHEFDDHALLLEERKTSDDWGAINNRWVLIDADGERTEFELSHRLFSATELTGLLDQSGFVDVQLFGGLDGTEFGVDGSRLVVTGRRPQ